MKYLNLTYLILISAMLLCSCSSDFAEEPSLPFLPGDESWEESIVEGSSATIKPFLPGDLVTRSSLEFDGQNLVFGWEENDLVGIYPTATSVYNEDFCYAHNDYPHPAGSDIWRIKPNKSPQTRFVCSELKQGSQTAKLTNDLPDYGLDEKDRWSAYFPYVDVNPNAEDYETRTFKFDKQTQEGLPDMTAYYIGDGVNSAGATNPKYRKSEQTACQHLGANDFLISPETEWIGTRINFQMRHLGAIIRLFLFAPEENLVITNIKLICDKPIFYSQGKFSLKSHPYDEFADNKGVNLNLADNEDCQIKPDGEPSNMIELDFKGETAKTNVESTTLQRYLVAYMMTYPITYTPATDGNLFAYVTAYKQGDSSKKEYHFVTNPLSGKVMKSGYYYQWTEMTHPDDGLYPIELTATLLPWQDIVGGGINTDLEK